ncbi:helix-turn-helix domain-containing protein [Microbacterium sp. SORGH_AS_0862]|uniref:helix-turn-helix domain-containing protein n=1 Tax=Microbacterium sp. SORGH_AS_0862 TaxID=3041789 RepID=UPI00278CEDFE|nr:XRE family transcriptional regulator [Microbacterium sp. SORGH_AS_0862]MDQ1204525.1 transcriptional regulator with XRE-family HTH domain [Microbacterium sp. SORGH_AS_0862]
MSEQPSPTAAAIGRAVREERTRRQLSTRALAAAAGVSQPFLTNVENGRVMPSIASLYSLAGALGVSAAALLPEQPIRLEVVRAGGGSRIPMRDSDGDKSSDRETYTQLIAGARGRQLGAYRFELTAGYEDVTYAHDGEDIVHVLSGSLVYRYADHDDVELHPGDTLWVDARSAHSWMVPAAQLGMTELLLITAAGATHRHGTSTDASTER